MELNIDKVYIYTCKAVQTTANAYGRERAQGRQPTEPPYINKTKHNERWYNTDYIINRVNEKYLQKIYDNL